MRATLEGVRLTVELAAVVAVGAWGAQTTTSPWRWAVAAACVAALVAIWGRFIAPKASHRLGDPARLFAEVGVFLAAGVSMSISFTRAAGVGLTLIAITDALALRATTGPNTLGSIRDPST